MSKQTSQDRRNGILDEVAKEEAAADKAAAKREAKRQAAEKKVYAAFGVKSASELARAGRWDDMRSLRSKLSTIARRYR